MNTTITLGGITFPETTRAGWMFDGLKDWWGQVDDKTPVSERPQGHGAFPVARAVRSSRAVSFNAVYLGGTQADVEDAVDALSAVGAEGPVRMTVTTPAGSSWRTVSVETSTFTDHQGRTVGRVAIDCVARDPRRYADSSWAETGVPSAGGGLVWPVVWPAVWPGGGADGRLVLSNSGRAPSAPAFRLGGGFGSATITCLETGARFGIDRTVPSGSVVEVDTANRRAVIDGQSDISRWLRYREWEVIPAGSSRTFQFDVTAPAGNPRLEGRVFPAWW